MRLEAAAFVIVRNVATGSKNQMSDARLRHLGAMFLCATALLVLWHAPASANIMVYPSAVSFAVAPFLWLPFFEAVMVAESIVYAEFLDLDVGNALFGAHLANIFSALVGALPIIVIGAPIEEFLRVLPISSKLALLMGSMIAAVTIPLINTTLEYPLLRLFGVRRGLRSFKIILLTNVATTLPYVGFFYFSSVGNR